MRLHIPARRRLLDSLNARNGQTLHELCAKYDRDRVRALSDLKRALEDHHMDKPSFVYTTFIRSTPERVWQAAIASGRVCRLHLGTFVKLTVIHDGFEPGSEVLETISQGWPYIVSNLKTLLETGGTLAESQAPVTDVQAASG